CSRSRPRSSRSASASQRRSGARSLHVDSARFVRLHDRKRADVPRHGTKITGGMRMREAVMPGTTMRVGVGQFNELTDEKLRFAAQIGASGIQLNTPMIPGDTHWEEKDLRALVDKAREYDLPIEAIENVPVHFYEKAMLGLPGRDEQIEHYRTTVRNLGRAGIPILGFHFMPNSVWRTARRAPGRG